MPEAIEPISPRMGPLLVGSGIALLALCVRVFLGQPVVESESLAAAAAVALARPITAFGLDPREVSELADTPRLYDDQEIEAQPPHVHLPVLPPVPPPVNPVPLPANPVSMAAAPA